MGKIFLSCGCEYQDTMGDMIDLDIRYRDEGCDAIDGFYKCVAYASYCPACKSRIADLLIHSDAEEKAWLAS